MQTKLSIVGVTSFCTYLCTYFLNLSMDNMEQYLAVAAVLWLDGIFGIWAGIKREGFKTYKALKNNKKYICLVSYFNSYTNGRKRIFWNRLAI